ncbi:nucleolin-like [Vigna umbellata]|uniref:nucleolin-like n=1 Tax=Vigna umbellata TaxID=87088 RepID=UPI001F5FD96C|nr:nucleolin-like [Vigna umbellata]
MEELSSLITVEKTMRTASVVEAMVVDTILVAAKSLLCLLILTAGSLLTDITPELTPIDGRFPFADLYKGRHTYLVNKDASESDDDEEEEDDDDANDQDDEEGDEDFSGESDEEAEPEDDPEANGAGGKDGEDGDEYNEEDEDEDEDEEEDEDEDEDEDEEEEEEVPQPPAKKRK